MIISRIFKVKPNKNVHTFLFNTKSDEVLLTVKNKCGIITLNRPKALNSLNRNMVNLIYPTLKKWQSDVEISHVVIEAVGEKAFCAGGDIRQVTVEGKKDAREAGQFFREEYCLNHLIGTLGKPYVALLHGITMGGGFGLSVHGRYRVCTDKTLFAMPETAIGLFPDVGGGYFLSRLPGQLGLYLALTGHRLRGQDVVAAGIGTHFVGSLDQMRSLRERLVEVAGEAAVSQTIVESCGNPQSHKFGLESHLSLIAEHFHHDSIEDILASLETSKNDEHKQWCQSQATLLRRASPTSLKITLRQLREAQDKSLAASLATEYRMAVGCLEHEDFYEGVRALIVDKDNQPRWSPGRLDQVTHNIVDSFFRPLPDDLHL